MDATHPWDLRSLSREFHSRGWVDAPTVDNDIYAARQGSPLVVGVGKNGTYLASDVPAFVEHTRDVVFLENGHRVIATKDRYTVLNRAREVVDVDVETVSYAAEARAKVGTTTISSKRSTNSPPHCGSVSPGEAMRWRG